MTAEDKAGKTAGGSPEANGVELTTTLYKKLHDLAAVRMSNEFHHQTLQATALVHEAWLRMRGGHKHDWENRTEFLSAAANTMRRILIDRARRRNAIRHGGGRYRMEMDAWNWENLAPDVTERYDRDLIDLDDALKRLSEIDRETEELVELRYFSGMDVQELAGIMGTSRRTIERRLSFARSWLKQDLEMA
jgi:RNA polymerase sigma factor (TIGR02999 family)